MKRRLSCITFVVILALLTQVLSAQVTIIDDDLNADTSADYTVVNGGAGGGGDGSLTFAYDYSADSIPPAPGTTDGSTTGVRITVNDTLNNGGVDETEAYTIFHNTELVGVTDYTLTMDVWLGVWAVPDNVGTTESAQIGVAADGVTRNHLFEFDGVGSTLSGSGHFLAVSSDGVDRSDYRHWEDNANGTNSPGPVNEFDPDYLSPDMGTNVITDNFIGFFEEISNINAPIPGVVGNNWATVKVEVTQSEGCPSLPGSEGCIKYFVRGGLPETTGDPSIQPPEPPIFLQVVESELQDAEGFANFGLADMYNSVATEPENQFAIFDNLFVEGSNPPPPDVTGDFNNDGNWDCNDINALSGAIASGSTDLSFDMNGDGAVTGADITDAIAGWLVVGGANNPLVTGGNPFINGDSNLDGTVDGPDFLAWNTNKFTSTSDWCLGDWNADGTADGQDFLIWNTNKFMSSDHATSAVPEPTAVLLLSLALAGLSVKRV